MSGPHPGSAELPTAVRRTVRRRRSRAEAQSRGHFTVLMCLGLLVLCLEWSDELIEVVAPRLLHLDDFAEVLLPVVHQVHLEQRRVRRVSEARERSA